MSTVVLLSGGIDSAYCLLEAQKKHCKSLCLVFANYGQDYLDKEYKAVKYLADITHLDLFCIVLGVIRPMPNGCYPGRNRTIIEEAYRRFAPRRLYFGTRNILPWLDRFGDSNFVFAKALGLECGIEILTPAVLKPKWYLRRSLRQAGIDLARLYSTEHYTFGPVKA